jgi:hypothetical protein
MVVYPCGGVDRPEGTDPSDRLGFIDQHDRNIIPNFIFQAAGLANEPVLLLCQIKLPFALGAYEYLKQVWLNRHVGLLTRIDPIVSSMHQAAIFHKSGESATANPLDRHNLTKLNQVADRHIDPSSRWQARRTSGKKKLLNLVSHAYTKHRRFQRLIHPRRSQWK